MSTTLGASAPVSRGAAAAASRSRRDRWFFAGMAAAAALTVLAGFAPTYYLGGWFGAPALPWLLHLHGALFTSWILLFAAQVAVVAAGQTQVHRRMGIAGGLLAGSMLVIGVEVALGFGRRGVPLPDGTPALVFMAIPLADLVVFTGLVAAALYFRRRTDTHKRLMLLATIGMLTPAIARLPGVELAGPLVYFGLTDLFLLACVLYDAAARRRVHPAFVWGGAWLLASQPLRFLVAGTDAWLAFARWMVS